MQNFSSANLIAFAATTDLIPELLKIALTAKVKPLTVHEGKSATPPSINRGGALLRAAQSPINLTCPPPENSVAD
jgi:hypothetical protein